MEDFSDFGSELTKDNLPPPPIATSQFWAC